MTNPNDFAFNDSATRLQSATPDGIEAKNPPLTKREYFAAMAMQGLLAADAKYQGKTNNYPLLAVDAIAHADALIKALNEKENG